MAAVPDQRQKYKVPGKDSLDQASRMSGWLPSLMAVLL